MASHPLQSGEIFHSLGGHFTYQVIGPCCRLFDREELPWPCCRLEWRGKEPSWRRIGRRFVLDMATKQAPSYNVEILGSNSQEPFVLTLYWVKLPQPIREWWYVRSLPQTDEQLPMLLELMAIFNRLKPDGYCESLAPSGSHNKPCTGLSCNPQRP